MSIRAILICDNLSPMGIITHDKQFITGKVTVVSGVWTRPTVIAWRCVVLSISQFPLSARPRVEVSLELIRMANRSPEPLGDFIRRIRKEKGLSCKGVEKQSARHGKPITASYVNRIENDPTKKPTAVALRKLAYGLDVPAQELLARAAGLVDPGVKSDEIHLLSRFRELSTERKADVLKMVDMWHSDEAPNRVPKRKSA